MISSALVAAACYARGVHFSADLLATVRSSAVTNAASGAPKISSDHC